MNDVRCSTDSLPDASGGVVIEGTDATAKRVGMRPVRTPSDVEHLRRIRNECRAYMTNDTSEITPEQQLAWWAKADGDPRWRIWLVYLPEWDEPVGFGLLRKGMRRWFVTLGLRSWVRGRGYGTLVYEGLAMQAPEVWAVIRETNVASIRAAEKAGYVRRDWPVRGVVAMRGRRP